ncbi:Uncharacterised protein [Pasteurella dagmatis]|uniref:Uncharacterized protein n=1 Tax=Pasteurella dagmatis ATCC 43325 TaxID=667128 RepID=C9PRJ4_9PAST|nr:hypothetical protein HMPREF0621_1618 [Pasteurella dagmatis ATCC 43325]SNV62565.1 Uncharacterised protein [Pasteurella dagmatis]
MYMIYPIAMSLFQCMVVIVKLKSLFKLVFFYNKDKTIKLNLSFDRSINSLRIIIYHGNKICFDLYKENLKSILLDENGNFISFFLECMQIELSIYPEFSVFIR